MIIQAFEERSHSEPKKLIHSVPKNLFWSEVKSTLTFNP